MQDTVAQMRVDQPLEVPNCRSTAREMEELLSHRLPYFYGVAYRFLGNAADAEDAVQDALLTAYKHLHQFRGDSKLSTWLTTIVCNSARMHLRRRPRHIQISLDQPTGEQQESTLSEQLACGEPTPEENCRRSEMKRHVVQAATRLTPALRRTLQLRDVDGLSTRETAKILGLASGTVKAQLSRARARVRRSVSQRLNRTRRTAVTSTR
jgi:RNA polymerase sigma-70 factor (ECF subfamily)